MRRSLILWVVAAGLPAAADAQFGPMEIHYNSEVSVEFDPELDGIGPYETISDTISGVSNYDTFNFNHSASYDDPDLPYDPTGASRFSVDSVDYVGPASPSNPDIALVDVTISGELFRSGPGPVVPFRFSQATSDLSFEIRGLPFTSGTQSLTYIEQYSIAASYSSDIDFEGPPFSLPAVTILGVRSNGTTVHLNSLQTQGPSQSTVLSGSALDNYSAVRIVVNADALDHLGPHPGITSVEFEGTLRVTALTPPEPCLADTNNDGEVTAADFSAWIAAFNANAPECDQNGDGACTAADFSAWIANFNAGCV